MAMTKITAQSWLNGIPSKVKLKVRAIGRKPSEQTEDYWELKPDEVLEGELKIDGFPELRLVSFQVDINSGDKGLLTKVTIVNCPELWNVNLTNNKVSELNVSGSSNLIYLLASNNELGKVNVKGCVNLQRVLTFGRLKIREEWEGLEDLENIENINSDFPFFSALTKGYKEAKRESNKGREIIDVITKAAKKYFGVTKGEEYWKDALGITNQLKYIENKYKAQTEAPPK